MDSPAPPETASGRCPVCGSAAATRLFKVRADEAAQHFVTRAQDGARHAALADHIASLWQAGECSVLRCGDCRFCYAYPYVAGDPDFYGLAYQGHGYPSAKWEFHRARDELASLLRTSLPRQVRLLEIGAGHGLFVREISPSLVRPQDIVCLEYSREGIEKIRAAGIHAQATDVRQFTSEQPFDVVCSFQVLEHLDRLDEVFARLRALTSETAHLFLSVPNPLRIDFYEANGGLLDMPPNHIGRWNREAMSIIGERHGWHLVGFEREPNHGWTFARQFAEYRFLRSRQRGGVLHALADKISWRPLKRAIQAPMVAWQLVRTLAYRDQLSRADMGDSLFFHLRKSAQPVAS